MADKKKKYTEAELRKLKLEMVKVRNAFSSVRTAPKTNKELGILDRSLKRYQKAKKAYEVYRDAFKEQKKQIKYDRDRGFVSEKEFDASVRGSAADRREELKKERAARKKKADKKKMEELQKKYEESERLKDLKNQEAADRYLKKTNPKEKPKKEKAKPKPKPKAKPKKTNKKWRRSKDLNL